MLAENKRLQRGFHCNWTLLNKVKKKKSNRCNRIWCYAAGLSDECITAVALWQHAEQWSAQSKGSFIKAAHSDASSWCLRLIYKYIDCQWKTVKHLWVMHQPTLDAYTYNPYLGIPVVTSHLFIDSLGSWFVRPCDYETFPVNTRSLPDNF